MAFCQIFEANVVWLSTRLYCATIECTWHHQPLDGDFKLWEQVFTEKSLTDAMHSRCHSMAADNNYCPSPANPTQFMVQCGMTWDKPTFEISWFISPPSHFSNHHPSHRYSRVLLQSRCHGNLQNCSPIPSSWAEQLSSLFPVPVCPSQFIFLHVGDPIITQAAYATRLCNRDV